MLEISGFEFGLLKAVNKNAKAYRTHAREAQDIIDELADEVRKLRTALLVEQAIGHGSGAQTLALREALAVEKPDHPLLRKTGRTVVETNQPETALKPIYDKAFDAYLAEYGITDTSKLRLQAK